MRAVIVAMILITTVGAPVLADDTTKAAAHYKQGKAFFDAKQYDQAIAEYQKAYALDHKAVHLFNIGGAYYLKGDFANAIDFYQKFLVVEPTGKRADEVRAHVVSATQQLADEAAKRRAGDEAARLAAEQAKVREEQEARRIAATAHVRQAEAYAQAGAWAKAGEEYRAAATVDGDPEHLLDAAEAYSKQPDNTQARDAYLAYLDKVPLGDKSEGIRRRVGAITLVIEKAAAEERQRNGRNPLPKPPPKPRNAQVVSLAANAKTAARRGDCRITTILGERIRQQDPDYYNGVFAREIHACGIVESKTPAIGATASVDSSAPAIDDATAPVLLRFEVGAGLESAQGDIDRSEFGGSWGLRPSVAVAITEHLSVRGEFHIAGPENSSDSNAPHVNTYDGGLGVEGRWVQNRTFELFGGGHLLFGKAVLEGARNPQGMRDTLLEVKGVGLGARGGFTLGRNGYGLSVYAAYMRITDGSSNYGFLGIYGSLSFGLRI